MHPCRLGGFHRNVHTEYGAHTQTRTFARPPHGCIQPVAIGERDDRLTQLTSALHQDLR